MSNYYSDKLIKHSDGSISIVTYKDEGVSDHKSLQAYHAHLEKEEFLAKTLRDNAKGIISDMQAEMQMEKYFEDHPEWDMSDDENFDLCEEDHRIIMAERNEY